jgi:uncharacterized protein DUF397
MTSAAVHERTHPVNVELAGPYRTSSFCGGGNCVEIAPLANGDVTMRDSKDTSLPSHRFTAQEWLDFVRGVKAGEFDFAG